jgi:hypothetical protein
MVGSSQDATQSETETHTGRAYHAARRFVVCLMSCRVSKGEHAYAGGAHFDL